MKRTKKSTILWTVLALLLVVGYNFFFRADANETGAPEQTWSIFEDYDSIPTACIVTEDGEYNSHTEVAEYIHQYGHLPSNYITKKEAEALGWDGGKLSDVAPGMYIGGDHFGNYEGRLPQGKEYTECDVNCPDKTRGAERVIFSDDGWIYYTADHYESFRLLYSGR